MAIQEYKAFVTPVLLLRSIRPRRNFAQAGLGPTATPSRCSTRTLACAQKMLGLVARRAAVNVPRVLARRGYAEVASNSDKLRLSLVLPHDVRSRDSLAGCASMPAIIFPQEILAGARRGSLPLWPSVLGAKRRFQLTICYPRLSARFPLHPREIRHIGHLLVAGCRSGQPRCRVG